MRNIKRIFGILSLVLTLVMLLSTFLPVFAVTITTDKKQLTGADIVSEDVSRREEFSKHYLTGDGTYFAVAYAEQVNYLDDNGKWKEVDNTLSTNILTGEKSTRNDKFKVKLANKANKDKLVSIHTNEFKVSWGLSISEDGTSFSALDKVKGVENEALKPGERKTTTDVQSLGKAVSGIIYEDAFGDYLDVRYSIAHQKVKEDLILNGKSAFNSYKVTYNVNNIKGVYTVLSDNGEVTFYNGDDDPLFKAGLPVMYDAAGKSSVDIDVQVTPGKKTVEVIYTPSAEWLNDNERVYPVTIDPYVQSSQYTSNIMDTSHYTAYGGDGSPTNARAVEDKLYIGTDEYACIKFHNVPYIPDYYSINGAEIQLYGKNYPFNEEGYYIYAAEITEYWNEYMFESSESDFVYDPDITYFSNSRWPQRGTQVTTQNPGTLISGMIDDLSSIQLDIKPILDANGGYQSFFDSYYGFLINDNDGANFLYVYSSEYENSTYRPSVIVRYSNTDAIPITSGSLYKLKNTETGNYLTCYPNASLITTSNNLPSEQIFKVVYNGANTNTYSFYPYTQYAYNKTGRAIGINYSANSNPNYYTPVLTSTYTEWTMSRTSNSQCFNICFSLKPSYCLGILNSNNLGVVLNTASNKLSWEFEEITDVINMNSGSSGTTFHNVNKTLFINPSIPVTDWSSSDSNVAYVDEYGMVITKNPGSAVISAYYSDNDMYQVSIEVLLSDGEYFIKNRHENNGRYLQIDDNVDDTPDGAFMELWALTGEDDQRWEISHFENGYYHIVSKDSGLALMVPYNKQNVEDEKIVQGTYHYGNENQLWRITKTQYGSYKIANRATITAKSNLVMCMGATAVEDSNGVNVRNRTYVDNESFRDEWELFLIGQYPYKLFAYKESSIDRDEYFNDVKTVIQSELIGDVYTDFYTSISKNDMKRFLIDSDIFIIHTHGQKNGFYISSSSYLSMNDINDLNLNNLGFALLLTCNTAKDFSTTHIDSNNSVNITEKMVCCGAETVVGFNEVTYVSDCNKFARDFINETVKNGKTVQEAINDIDYTNGYRYKMNNFAEIGGNVDKRLK